MRNPWLKPAPDYYPDEVGLIQSVSVEDRIAELKDFYTAKIRRVIAWPGTQKTVRLAAERLLKRRLKNADKSGG